jgi:hypothetical protein
MFAVAAGRKQAAARIHGQTHGQTPAPVVPPNQRAAAQRGASAGDGQQRAPADPRRPQQAQHDQQAQQAQHDQQAQQAQQAREGRDWKESTRPLSRGPALGAWGHSDVLMNPLAAAPPNIRLFAPTRKPPRAPPVASRFFPSHSPRLSPLTLAAQPRAATRSRAIPRPTESSCSTKSNSGPPSHG